MIIIKDNHLEYSDIKVFCILFMGLSVCTKHALIFNITLTIRTMTHDLLRGVLKYPRLNYDLVEDSRLGSLVFIR